MSVSDNLLSVCLVCSPQYSVGSLRAERLSVWPRSDPQHLNHLCIFIQGLNRQSHMVRTNDHLTAWTSSPGVQEKVKIREVHFETVIWTKRKTYLEKLSKYEPTQPMSHFLKSGVLPHTATGRSRLCSLISRRSYEWAEIFCWRCPYQPFHVSQAMSSLWWWETGEGS